MFACPQSFGCVAHHYLFWDNISGPTVRSIFWRPKLDIFTKTPSLSKSDSGVWSLAGKWLIQTEESNPNIFPKTAAQSNCFLFPPYGTNKQVTLCFINERIWTPQQGLQLICWYRFCCSCLTMLYTFSFCGQVFQNKCVLFQRWAFGGFFCFISYYRASLSLPLGTLLY